MVKHTQIIRWQQPTNCLSVSEYFVSLGLKEFTRHVKISLSCPIGLWLLFVTNTYPKNKSNIKNSNFFVLTNFQILPQNAMLDKKTYCLRVSFFNCTTYIWRKLRLRVSFFNCTTYIWRKLRKRWLSNNSVTKSTYYPTKYYQIYEKKITGDVYYSDLNFVAFLQKFP